MRYNYHKPPINFVQKRMTRDDINYDIFEDLKSSLGWLITILNKTGHIYENRRIDKFTYQIKIENLKIDIIAEKVTVWRSHWSWKVNGERLDTSNFYQLTAFMEKHFDIITQAKYWINGYDPTAQFSDDYRYVHYADTCLEKLRKVFALAKGNNKIRIKTLASKKNIQL